MIATASPRLIRWGTLWNSFVRVHPSITDIKQRQQARLLAGLMVAMIITTLMAMGMLSFVRGLIVPTELRFVLPGQIATLILYFLNRNGYYRPSATLFIALNAALIHLVPVLSGDIAWFFFVSMLVTISAILLSFEFTVLLLIASLLFQITIGAIDYQTQVVGSASTFGVSLVNSTMVLIFLSHRRRLEIERRAELEKLNHQLRQSEADLERRVTERTHELAVAIQIAEKARATAEDASKIKSQFLANMSHELRTPLNAILNFTGFVADGVMGPVNPQQENALTQALSSGQHLLALINDILDITKIEAQMMDLFIQEVNMNDILEASVSTAKALAKGKSLEVYSDLQADMPTTFGDRRRLRQVMLNIISNAVKFTTEGRITIKAHHEDHMLHISVADTGIGIAPEDQSLVFESFRQDKYQPAEASGTGLGMPISKYFVETHGGRIWLESTIGVGTTFFIELPILNQAEAQARANLRPELA